MKKWIKFLDLFVLFLASLIFIIYTINNYYLSPPIAPKECVDVNLAPSFYYESCYDAYSKTIFLGIKRGQDSYNLKDISISFFDLSNKKYSLGEVPDLGKEKVYKIPAEKNPKNIDIYLEVSSKDFYNSICEAPRKVFVGYCSEIISLESAKIIYNPLNNFYIKDFVEIKEDTKEKEDLFALSLIEKEKIWMLQCNSDWDCSSWGPCENGIQRRNCYDKNKCFISISIPEISRYCIKECVESWQCQWSKCMGGFTTPTCVDLNNCGTDYDAPKKIRCFNSKCTPNIYCSTWSNCEVDYNFLDLVNLQLNDIKGIKRRTCRDKNSCAEDIEEVSQCSIGVDIYTKTFENCGIEFIGVYNCLDDSLIARIEQGTENNPYLNIILDEEKENLYCDYCFDGILNGDEEKVDCGGSCISCKEKYPY